MNGIQSLQPRLVVADADAALAFYVAAFDATVTQRVHDPAGRVVHAQVTAGDARFTVKDADGHDPAPGTGGVPVILSLQVDDPDAVAAAMSEHGAAVLFAVDDHPYGERAGRLRDPAGHVWMVARRTETLDDEALQQRTTAMFERG